MESGPSAKVPGERGSFPASKVLCREGLLGEVIMDSLLGCVSVVGLRGLPAIIAAHTASTSIVAAVVSARGFFLTSLLYCKHVAFVHF